MTTRPSLLWAVYGTLGAFLVIMAVFASVLALSYEGKCGGFFPGLAPAAPCSRWAYMAGDVLVFALVMWNAYWPLVMALLVFAALAGYVLGRRRQHRAA